MSKIANTKTVVVGENTELIKSVTAYLKEEAGQVRNDIFSNIEPKDLHEQNIDLVVASCQDDISSCRELLFLLQESELTKELPVLIVLDNDKETKEDLLFLGAADYITKADTADDIKDKLNQLFGAEEKDKGVNVIDITPHKKAIHKKGLKVFVVEDDALLRNLLATKLSSADFPCEFSIDGTNAVEGIRTFKPDVIILDIMLPKNDGFAVLADIKNDPGINDIPVIIFSNKDEAEDREKAKSLGAESYLVKAMTELSELIEEIQRLAK